MIKNNKNNTFDWLHQISFWAIALLLFIPPYFRGLFFSREQEWALVFAALVFWITFIWWWLPGKRSFLATPIDIFALALPLVYLLSFFFAANKGLALAEVIKNTLYFLTLWSVSKLVRDDQDAKNIILVIYAAAVGLSLVGLAAATEIIHIKDAFLDGRIGSSFQYANALASYLGAAVLMGTYFWNNALAGYLHAAASLHRKPGLGLARSRIRGYVFAGGNFLLLAAFWGTKSRGGLLVFGLVFLIGLLGLEPGKRLTSFLHLSCLGVVSYLAANAFIPLAVNGDMVPAWLWIAAGLLAVCAGQVLFDYGASRLPKAAWTVLAALIIVAAAAGLASQTGTLGNLSSFDYLKTAYHRLYYMEAAADMISDRPLLGWGGGGWQEAYQAYLGYNLTSRQVHSFYLQLGVETGILGLLALAGIWFSFLYMAHRQYRTAKDDPGRRELVWLVTTVFLMLAGHAIIDFDLSLSALSLVLWGFLGIMSRLGRPGDAAPAQAGVLNRWLPFGAASLAALIIFSACLCLTHARGLMDRSFASIHAGQLGQGLAHMEAAAKYNPFEPGYRTQLAGFYQQLDKKEPALAQAKQAVKLSQHDVRPRQNLVQIAMATGDYETAAVAAGDIIHLAPNNLDVYENQARDLAYLGLQELKAGHPDQSRKHFQNCLQVPEKIQKQLENLTERDKEMWKGPQLQASPKVNLYCGQASYWLGDYELARECLLEANQKDTKARALLYLALMWHRLGQENQVNLLLERLETLSPETSLEYEKLKDVSPFE